MPEQLRVTTLGGLRIQINNQPVTGFVSRKVEALLVYLVANPREHPREILGEMLWDDLPQARTMSYLRTALSSLQKQLAPYLLVTRQTIAINPETPYWVDAIELDSVLDMVEEKWHTHRSFTRFTAAKLEEALALYKGMFLQGFYVRDARGFEGWQMLEQERLRNRVLEALCRLGGYYLDHGLYSSGIAHITRALQIDPLWEKAHYLQMRLLAQSGQRSAALAQYETCRQLLDEELGIEPEEETTALYEQILAGNLTAVTREAVPNNLAAPATSFVDRPDEFQRISEQLDRLDCRLLTLIGPGGIGKSRLAMEIARKNLDYFKHGVYFINFAPVSNPDQITNTIANILNITFQQGRSPEDELLDYLRDREMLLVLDNLEHLLAGADILSHMLETAPDLKLLVTARERLNLQEEWLYTIDALPIPDQGATKNEALTSPAVKLFTQTAQRMRPEFEAEAEWESIVRICRLVKGMPLAIELAASWARLMSTEQIAAEVERGLDIFTTSLRNIPERHRSIRSVFESSWNQLTEDEQRILRQLAVFRESFQLPAAEAVAGANIFRLSAFVDKSLLTPINDHYTFHELLRQFAEEKLNQHPEERANALYQHCAYYAGYMHEHRLRLSNSLPGSVYLSVMRSINNIWAAWTYALENKLEHFIDQLLIPLYRIHDIQSRYYEGERIFRYAVDQLQANVNKPLSPTQARALLLLGLCLQNLNIYDEALTLVQASLPVLREHDLQWEIRSAEACLGNIAYSRSDYLSAQTHFETVRTMLEVGDDLPTYVTTLMRLSDLAGVLGNYERARQIMEESLPLLDASGSKRSRTRFVITIGDIELKLGRLDQAQNYFQSALELSHELESPTTLAVAQVSLARVAHALGDHTRAQFLCRESISLCDEIHNQWGKAFALVHLGRACVAAKRFAEALRHYHDSLIICDKIGSLWIKAVALRHQGSLQCQLAHLDKGVFDLTQALEIASQIKAQPIVLDILAAVAEILDMHSHADRAISLAAFVANHQVSEYETRRLALTILENHDFQLKTVEVDFAPEVIQQWLSDLAQQVTQT